MDQLSESSICFQDYIHFHVTDSKVSWSHLFITMESAKSLFSTDIIGDYSVSETTLEQVFISFAKPEKDDANTHAT